MCGGGKVIGRDDDGQVCVVEERLLVGMMMVTAKLWWVSLFSNSIIGMRCPMLGLGIMATTTSGCDCCCWSCMLCVGVCVCVFFFFWWW